MKRYLLCLCCLIVTLIGAAKPLNLNVEKLFEGGYNSNPHVSIHISKSKSKFYRGFTVNNDASLVQQVVMLFRKDEPESEDSQEFIEAGRLTYSSLTFYNNGEKISVGLSFSNPNSCYLFITGSPKAFESGSVF